MIYPSIKARLPSLTFNLHEVQVLPKAAAIDSSSNHLTGDLPSSSMVSVSFNLIPKFFIMIRPTGKLLDVPRELPRKKWNAFGRFSVAFYASFPVEVRNWTDNPKPEFLCVFRADKTVFTEQTSPILLKLLNESKFHHLISRLPAYVGFLYKKCLHDLVYQLINYLSTMFFFTQLRNRNMTWRKTTFWRIYDFKIP